MEEANAYRNRALAGGRITGASPSVTNAVGKKLEDIIESDPAMLGEALMILGRQVKTDSGKVISLLGIDAEGGVHVPELKRDRTPRDLVAQILDYGSWVEQLSQKPIRDICDHYRADGPS